jgi:hypothetical protein
MRASRRINDAASRKALPVSVAAALLVCLLTASGTVAWAQAPGEANPGEPSNGGVSQPDSEPPRREHDRARDAVREGQALPLGDIIRDLQRSCPGTFLNAALEDRDGRLVYRLQTLSTSGRRLFTIIDAATGSVVSGGCR